MSHTPGPWAYDRDSKEIFSSVEEHGSGWIAWVKGNDSEGRELSAEMQAANVSLIAAAPELLAALKELTHYDEGSIDSGSYGDEVLQRCKAAIAKAEGRGE